MMQRAKTIEANKNKLKKFLTFLLGGERFAIDISSVQELKSYNSVKDILHLSDAPSYINGIMYAYDSVIPIVDMNTLYHLEPVKDQKFLIIIILKSAGKYLGLTVDYDFDIIELSEDEIKISPESFSFVHHQYIRGVGKSRDQLFIILDADKLMHIVDDIDVTLTQ